MITTLMVFGASGDLTGRLLLPALASLQAAGVLGLDFRLVGAGQEPWSTEDFAGHARAQLGEHAPWLAVEDRDNLIAALRYQQADVTDPRAVAVVLDVARAQSGSGPVAVYLALPTQLMLAAVRALHGYALPAGSRVAVEKPFGEDLDSAAELNAALVDVVGLAEQNAIYRIDHVLAMPAVSQLTRVLRPGTGRPIEWNNQHIAKLELLWEETLALEGRASFYDRAGALRDVMQNHLLQVLCIVAQPSATAGADLGDPSGPRAEVLRSVRALSAADARTRTRRARYLSGHLAGRGGAAGRVVPDYSAEQGVDPARNTETFAEVTLELDTPQWVGTQFVLRAGKALSRRRRGVLIHFRPGDHGPADTPPSAWLDLDQLDEPRSGSAEAAGYQRLIADVLSGGTRYAVSAAETELAWHVFTPVLRSWNDGMPALVTYPAGSTGPPRQAEPADRTLFA